MKLEHIGVFVQDIERMKNFYVSCFSGTSTPKYTNINKGFESYFINFCNKSRLELMHLNSTESSLGKSNTGFHHISFEFLTKEEVNTYTLKVKENGGKILINARISGMGDYVSTVEDPEGNVIELLVLNKE